MVMVTSCSLLFFIVLSRHLTQAWIKSQLCFPHSSIPTGPNWIPEACGRFYMVTYQVKDNSLPKTAPSLICFLSCSLGKSSAHFLGYWKGRALHPLQCCQKEKASTKKGEKRIQSICLHMKNPDLRETKSLSKCANRFCSFRFIGFVF